MAEIQRVLIPTDFTIDSLRSALQYLEGMEGDKIEIVLAGGYKMDSSITGLLGFSKEFYLDIVQTEDFIKGCSMIRSRFENKVSEIYADLILSRNIRYLRNYLNGAGITKIVIAEGYDFQSSIKNSFNISELLKEHVPGNIQVVSLKSDKRALQDIDALDGIFFRKDWRLGYE